MDDEFLFELADTVQRANRTIMALQLVLAHTLGEFEVPLDYL